MVQRINTYATRSTFAPEDVRLLIGMDFLDNMVLSLDFERMRMDVQRSSGFKAPKETPLAMVESRSGWGRLLLPVDLGGARAKLLLDTAASSALHLESTYVANTPALKALPASPHMIAGIDGVREQTAIILPSIKIGGETFSNVRASSSSFGPMLRSDDMDGIVGVELLKRFNLVIDFGGHRLWMTANANRDAPQR